MPCLDISTNVCLDGVDTDSIFSEATKAVASIIGKPESVCSLSLSLWNGFASYLQANFLFFRVILPELELKRLGPTSSIGFTKY